MKYMCALSGSGTVKCNGKPVSRASYDFDCFFQPPNGVTSSGEIRLSAGALGDVFGRKDIQLLTDDGRLLDIRFSEKALPAASTVAHVDVTGDLPARPK